MVFVMATPMKNGLPVFSTERKRTAVSAQAHVKGRSELLLAAAASLAKNTFGEGRIEIAVHCSALCVAHWCICTFHCFRAQAC